jgi:hypothetical protein
VEAEPPQQRASVQLELELLDDMGVEGGGEGGGDGAAVEMAATSTIRMDGSFNSPLVS